MTTVSTRLGTGSLAASLIGFLTLGGDALNIIVSLDTDSGLSSVLEPLFSAANLAGFLLGLASRADRSRRGAVGLHLSWAPIVTVLLVLTAYQPRLAAALIERLAGLVLAVFGGIADTITLLIT